MRRVWCWLTGHAVVDEITWWIGDVYPIREVWCECCGRWLRVTLGLRRRPSWLS